MAPHSPTVLRTLGNLARGLLGLAVLAALVGGVPYLLLAVGHQPTELSGGLDLVLKEDDGSLFLVVLTCIGWAAWGAFALSVLVELVAVLRRRSAPRLKGLGGMQSVASFLIGGIVLLAPATASATTAGPAVAATAEQTVGQSATSDAAGTGKDTAAAGHSRAAQLPTHTVSGPSELPWDLAEQYLGDGTRWKDIAALNPGVPQLAAGDQFLPEGTHITLPADARTSGKTPAAAHESGPAPQNAEDPRLLEETPVASSQESDQTYVVKPGDTMWDITDREIGDPTRYMDIADANKNVVEDPDLIYPGEKLVVPTPAGGDEHSPDAPADERQDPSGTDGTDEAPETPPSDGGESGEQDKDSAAEEGEPEEEEDAPPAENASPPRAEATPEASSPPATAPPEGSQSPDASAPPRTEKSDSDPRTANTASETEDSSTTGIVALAGAGVLAGAIVLMLARRRIMQQRRRRPGRSIPMPTGRTAHTERALRSIDAHAELEHLDAALRTAALQLAEDARPLPELAAVQLGAEGARLHLTEPLPPVAPFTAEPEQHQVWWCPADGTELLDEAQLRDVDPPFPALVALGEDGDGGIVLVDLEQVGAIHLTGSLREQVLRTLGIALTLSPLAGEMDVLVAGDDTAPGMTILAPDRVALHSSLGDAVQAVAAHHDEQQQVLAALGPDGLAAARPDDEVGELWPMVVLADLDGCADPEASTRLLDLLGATPRSAVAIVTSGMGPLAGDGAGVWEVDTDSPSVTVPATTLTCHLAACSDDDYADVMELALTADSPTDVPAAASPTPPERPVFTVTGPAFPDDKRFGPPVDREDTALPEDAEESGAESVAFVPAPKEEPRPPSILAELVDLDDDLVEVPDGEDHASAPLAPYSEPTDEPVADDSAGKLLEEATDSTPPGPTDSALAPPASRRPAGASASDTVLPALVTPPRVSARVPEPDADETPHETPVDGLLAGHDATDGRPEPDRDETAPAPMVLLLGPVDLDGAEGTIASNRHGTALELAAWLALHPGADRHQIDEVLAPGGRVQRDTRNTRVADVRRWLGTRPDGAHYLPHISSQPDKRLRFAGVDCDWHEFQRLRSEAEAPDAPVERLLRQALELVRGRPFAGVPPRRYVWAEHLTQDMIEKIVDAATALGDRRLADRDPRGALWAATRGLEAAREVESLWRIRLRALSLLGAEEELEQAIRDLEALLLDLGASMDAETEETLRLLEAARR
ncbi:LysM domain/BON superfamily protein [Streptomyces sp. YIM 130001]|uniref:LysM peptidoglycan-binding domain-containing protein n=1 Tax=Streptomyces sp. YIM 130001 TaxID=2259644 RepID=UPI000EE23024|nr:LysM peptidoglycan-binding domain-containing protein [Streptomyces sp. YIM 130001]RII07950.1 LysM domain/BON superfamily protein [Streptomyces sp. YIM 130001]